ncbi:hypothetical protein FHX37_3412 [Haloactinospora alba]|uniref:Uncharacterized protein n=1 Tax=Haloactinospora alba TaxID=405555 RepID=A0A543NNN0_9ACTN|nr:hypothetical protein FHX37_3412 [Haloactinospora alba]
MPQFMHNLASLWTLLVILAIALFPRTRYRHRRERLEPHAAVPLASRRRAAARRFTVPPQRFPATRPEPVAGTLSEPEVLDPEEHSPVRPYVTQHERHRREQEEGRRCPACGAAVASDIAPESSTPPAFGDGLDDVRAELSPLVRQWLSQREEKSTVGVVR